MGFWPFGREPADIEIASRVITAAAQNGYRVRGKLTIHFSEPQRQSDADIAADRCASIAVALLRTAPDHGQLIGAETQLSAELTARYPGDIAPARAIELAALHVVGDPTLSDELRRASGTGPLPVVPRRTSSSGSMPAVVPPRTSSSMSMPAVVPPRTSSSMSIPAVVPPATMGPQATPTPGPTRGAVTMGPQAAPNPGPLRGPSTPPSNPPAAARGSNPPAAPAAPPSGPPPYRRRASSQIRSIQSLLMPPGTPPSGMGAFVAPMVRDSAARLLIGFLRAHDLIHLRDAAIEDSAEMLANLVPVSDAPPGGYEASRAGEIARWQGKLGQPAISAIHREVKAIIVHLAKDALGRVEVMPALADAVVEAICAAAFPEEAGLRGEIQRYPGAKTPEFMNVVGQNLTRLTPGKCDDPDSIAVALAPLVQMVQQDVDVTAMIIKQSSGG